MHEYNITVIYRVLKNPVADRTPCPTSYPEFLTTRATE